MLAAANLLVSVGHRPILPAECSIFLHLDKSALSDAVQTSEHCSTKYLGLADRPSTDSADKHSFVVRKPVRTVHLS